jgi:hypothetical protein
MDELIIHDGNAHQFVNVDPNLHGRGLVPRSFAAVPYGSLPHAPAFDLPLIPTSEWAERIADMEASGSRLSDIRMRGNFGQMIPSQDQNGKGYCWAHSTTGAVMIYRALANLPYVNLSAYGVACIEKSYRDEGGWCGESLRFIVEKGVPSADFWPLRSMSRSNDKPETWANAALHKITEGFYDLSRGEYDQVMSWQQFGTARLLRMPGSQDHNWWSHSVGSLDLVNGASQRGVTRAESGKLMELAEFDKVWAMDHPVTGGIGCRIWNSWGDTWSQKGMGILTGNQAIPDNALCVNVAGVGAS